MFLVCHFTGWGVLLIYNPSIFPMCCRLQVFGASGRSRRSSPGRATDVDLPTAGLPAQGHIGVMV